MSYNYTDNNYDLEAVKFGGFWIRFLARIIDIGIFVFIWILGVLIYYSTIDSNYYSTLSIYQLTPFYIVGFIFSDNPITGLVIFIILFSLFYFLYFVLMNGLIGATLGKMVTGLVIKEERSLQEIGIAKAIGRFFALEFISGLVFYLGFLWAAWDEEKQAWHDKLARTVVVYKNSLIPANTFTNDYDLVEEREKDVLKMRGKEFGELVFTKGLNKGKHYPLKGESIKIGRKKDAVHIFIKDPEKFVSRIQCEIFAKDNRYYIRNLSSSNTTKLNGSIVRSEVPLRDRDILSFGSHSVKILFF